MSAYQDKIVDKAHVNYHRVVKSIVNNFGHINFSNFVRMILKARRRSGSMDIHWKPFFRRCGYCDIPYKVIGKAETFGEDVKFLGRLAKINFQPIGERN